MDRRTHRHGGDSGGFLRERDLNQMGTAMTAYAFAQGRLEAEGCKAILHQVSLDFEQKLESLTGQNKVAVALGDGELKITGKAERVELIEGTLPEYGQIYFVTTTSNFGMAKEVTIKLNCCRMNGNSFHAIADERGNVFTLSMTE